MYQWSNTWDRSYQKAIREPIHLAHLSRSITSALRSEVTQCSESARQLLFPCSQPAIQCRTLIKDKRSPESHNHTSCTDFYYHSQWLFTQVHVCLYTNHRSGQATSELTLQGPSVVSALRVKLVQSVLLHSHHFILLMCRIWAFKSILTSRFTQEAPASL